MKEQTKKNLKDNLFIIFAMLISGAMVYQMESCKRQNENKAQHKEATVNKAQNDTVVAPARVAMIQNQKTR